ncbi:MAG TPA: T9SS type A sorting domain-containing protein, partial [Ferruginibacter sp.]|nr:T9SS type A sorting domain-containing protein [Ferruginibacter sp.]
PIPNYQQMHAQVVLLSADNWGDVNNPATVASGQSFTKTYTYTLPSTIYANHVKIVAFINERVGSSPVMSSGTEILNAEVKSIWATTTGVEEQAFDGAISVSPNPFSTIAAFAFQLKDEATVHAYITDLNGRLIKNLINEKRLVGKHEVFWGGDNETSQQVQGGVYLIHITTPTSKITSKVVYMPN